MLVRIATAKRDVAPKSQVAGEALMPGPSFRIRANGAAAGILPPGLGTAACLYLCWWRWVLRRRPGAHQGRREEAPAGLRVGGLGEPRGRKI